MTRERVKPPLAKQGFEARREVDVLQRLIELTQDLPDVPDVEAPRGAW